MNGIETLLHERARLQLTMPNVNSSPTVTDAEKRQKVELRTKAEIGERLINATKSTVEVLQRAKIPKQDYRVLAQWHKAAMFKDSREMYRIFEANTTKLGWILQLYHHNNKTDTYPPKSTLFLGDNEFGLLPNFVIRASGYSGDTEDQVFLNFTETRSRQPSEDDIQDHWKNLTFPYDYDIDMSKKMFLGYHESVGIGGLCLVLNHHKTALDIYDTQTCSRHEQPDNTYRSPLYESLGDAIGRLARKEGIKL